MATLFYLPASGAAAQQPPAPSGTDWGHINASGAEANARVLSLVNGGSSLADVTYSPDAGDHIANVNAMVQQFVSDLFPPQTIAAQTIALMVSAAEEAGSNNLFVTWKLYAIDESNNVLGTLVAVRRDGTEVTTSAVSGRMDSVTSTQVAPTVPFRLVLEVGLGGTPTNSATDTHNGSVRFGESGTEFLQNSDATDGNPYLLLNSDIIRSPGGAALGSPMASRLVA